jgi:hypothetical protein
MLATVLNRQLAKACRDEGGQSQAESADLRSKQSRFLAPLPLSFYRLRWQTGDNPDEEATVSRPIHRLAAQPLMCGIHGGSDLETLRPPMIHRSLAPLAPSSPLYLYTSSAPLNTGDRTILAPE